MADGSEKKIEEVKKGEFVLTADPETGELQARQVTATITGDGVKHLVTLTVDPDGKDGEGKAAKITATSGHPFWLPEYGRWAEAGDLEPGMWLETAAGTWVQITAIDDAHRSQKVHNLTVEGQHTYFALAGDTALLVHNRGMVPLNCSSDQLAQVSMNARMTERVHPGRNIAVYRVGEGDSARYLAAANKGDLHSEEVLDKYLLDNNISRSDVTGIYSERQPCHSEAHKCAALMNSYPSLGGELSWSLAPDSNAKKRNIAAIASAMGRYRGPSAGIPGYEWIS
jgi:hypothetical protein